jgi:hypothetical protein
VGKEVLGIRDDKINIEKISTDTIDTISQIQHTSYKTHARFKRRFSLPSPKSGITKIITDEPTEDDALHFNNYSQKLADIIANSTPRFAIGVFGGWGTGKTSLIQMTKKILDHNSKIVTVWSDTWRYEREQNLAVIPFLRTIKLTLDASEESKEGTLNGIVYSQSNYAIWIRMVSRIFVHQSF